MKNGNEYVSIGTELKNYRNEHNLTQFGLSEILSISPGYLGSIERGQKAPGRDLLILISNKLSISMDKLVYDNSEYATLLAGNEYLEKISKLPPEKRNRIYRILDELLKF